MNTLNIFESTKVELAKRQRTWLVTGAAGFIGSHLVEFLLQLNQKVIGVDNFANGSRANLDEIQVKVGERWRNLRFIDGDILDLSLCLAVTKGVDVVLHEAALGSVPRSIADPLNTHDSNVTGFLNCLIAARDNRVARFVYASSSAVYGDSESLPRREGTLGRCLSPYAVSKLVNECYADVFSRCYKMKTVGLRYFNVFGPRQNPNGPYAAVIPRWIVSMLQNRPVYINGDGSTSRDFCYVANVVQANILAATCTDCSANAVFNVAGGNPITLNKLFGEIKERLAHVCGGLKDFSPVYREFRAGDVKNSCADIAHASAQLGFHPWTNWSEQINETIAWYRSRPSIANLYEH